MNLFWNRTRAQAYHIYIKPNDYGRFSFGVDIDATILCRYIRLGIIQTGNNSVDLLCLSFISFSLRFAYIVLLFSHLMWVQSHDYSHITFIHTHTHLCKTKENQILIVFSVVASSFFIHGITQPTTTKVQTKKLMWKKRSEMMERTRERRKKKFTCEYVSRNEMNALDCGLAFILSAFVVFGFLLQPFVVRSAKFRLAR